MSIDTGDTSTESNDNMVSQNADTGIGNVALYNLGRIRRSLDALASKPKWDPSDTAGFDCMHYFGDGALEKACQRLGMQPGQTVIDIGSGFSATGRYFHKTCGVDVTGVELQAEIHELAEIITKRNGLAGGVRSVNADFTKLTVDAPVDYIVSFLCILHIPDRQALFQKVAGSLKPGGQVYIEDFFARTTLDRNASDQLRDIVSCPYLPSREQYISHLTNAGLHSVQFEETSEDWAEFVHERAVRNRQEGTRGERVAVAHLLKRPLIRVKQIAKLMRCVDSIVASNDTHELLRDFENLQDKARRRYREETARIVDEEAANTDTSRCRDLGTLDGCHAVLVDPSRQVSAKDIFSLSLCHSNGQRLDCQVELIHRDNQKNITDRGDVLIRETGGSRKSYLLFPPISMSMISARTGDSHFDIIVMVRGTTKEVTWREVFTLTADNEDQILDWLDILPLHPVPPLEFGPQAPREAEEKPQSQPRTPTRQREPLVGTATEASPEKSPRSPIAKDVSVSTPTSTSKTATPSRYHPRTPTAGQTPPSSVTQSPQRHPEDLDKTPTKDDYHARANPESRGRPLKESMRPDPTSFQPRRQAQAPNSTPYRQDGAPPPPVHRTLSTSLKTEGGDISKSAPAIPPPAADHHGSDRLKRRGSSPLKHEYLPSDQSSTSEAYSTEESEVESSDDEIESLDIPETELGVSIKEEGRRRPQPSSTLIPESECSLTPSNSASQGGLRENSVAPDEQIARYMARISRWSDKGMWKDIVADPCTVVVTNGLIEAYNCRTASENGNTDPPLLALDLTPVVLIRQSTAVDLEIRSSVQSHSKLYQSHNGGNFRFRCFAAPDCYNLYMSVHQARLHNQKFIQLENEARFKSFGERQSPENDGETSSRRRSWFGRKNSYRSSIRAPSQSHDGASTTPSSTPSASSFLKRLTVKGNMSFNIAKSSVDRQSRAGSGVHSLYTSGSSSASGTPPRSPSVSLAQSSHHPMHLGTDNIRIRLHLLVTSTKWEDYGNCSLQIRRPPPGWRQALRADHGLEKRITVTTLPKKDSEEAKIVLDAVLGSGCFSAMGSRGIVCGVWEEVKNGDGVVGMVPETGATGGNIKKWCFQFSNAAEANGVLTLVHQEVLRA